MNYFLLFKSKLNYPLTFSLTNKINGSWLAMGKFIPGAPDLPLRYEDADNSKVAYESLLTYDILETVGGGILFSERFKNLVVEYAKNEVQVFPTEFSYKGVHNTSYYAINIFNTVDCYDLSTSVYTKHPVDGSLKFSKATLKTTPLEEYGYEYHIVRSAEDNKIVVSDIFKQQVEAAGINSVGFKK
ncbi:imm11 family protein [Polluticaenibacter yanchengensis]|uniref:Immunity MXAN-0049 protein domain-containing protein n=1 Tax=Polluticaenibacter yanchengensis TaxID=3014562 RepID=A0ABT4UEZ0_9BACT|nr:hypothetical protein [Chitinophagaceae bacterium LY-5]